MAFFKDLMSQKNKKSSFHTAGWVFFVICALLFLYIAVREHDLVLILASLLFLCGCVAFLIPLLFPTAFGMTSPDRDDSQEGKNKNCLK